MPDDPYTLADLSRLADVTPRTIRYYVAQGLLASPEAAGPQTRYGEGHLLRLRLIRRLQREHLPLAEIRSRLERLSDEEVGQALYEGGAVAAPDPSSATTLAFVRELMTQTGVTPTVAAAMPVAGSREPAPSTEAAPAVADASPAAARLSAAPPDRLLRRATYEPRTPDGYPVREPSATPVTAPGLVASQPAPAAPGARTGIPDRSTWERIAITPDLEIQVRRPLDRQHHKRVEQLLRIARELFDEEP